MAGTIFISYRRTDAAAWAGRISDDLEAKLPGVQVVFDVVSIMPGQDFVEEIRRSVRDADVILAVIGATWLETKGADGKRRIDDPLDFVRLELEIALNEDDAVVIPVLIDGAQMPREIDLPEPLRRLSHRNAVQVTHANFKRDVEFLRQSIQTILARQKPQPAKPQLDPPYIPPKPEPAPAPPPAASKQETPAAPAGAIDPAIDKALRAAFTQLTAPGTPEATVLMFEHRTSKRLVLYTRAEPVIAMTIYADKLSAAQKDKAEAFLTSTWADANPQVLFNEANRVYRADFPPGDIDRLISVTTTAFDSIIGTPLTRAPKVTFGSVDFSNRPLR